MLMPFSHTTRPDILLQRRSTEIVMCSLQVKDLKREKLQSRGTEVALIIIMITSAII